MHAIVPVVILSVQQSGRIICMDEEELKRKKSSQHLEKVPFLPSPGTYITLNKAHAICAIRLSLHNDSKIIQCNCSSKKQKQRNDRTLNTCSLQASRMLKDYRVT